MKRFGNVPGLKFVSRTGRTPCAHQPSLPEMWWVLGDTAGQAGNSPILFFPQNFLLLGADVQFQPLAGR